MKKAVLKAEKIKEWIKKGAQASDTAWNLFVKEGIIEGKKRVIKVPKKAVPEAPVEEVKTEEKTSADTPAVADKEETKVEANEAKPE